MTAPRRDRRALAPVAALFAAWSCAIAGIGRRQVATAREVARAVAFEDAAESRRSAPPRRAGAAAAPTSRAAPASAPEPAEIAAWPRSRCV
ncbi:MAG TPA: hypothetical protein VEI02_10535, partial [Planctomycetota bacterium]|nr:hypothetical protein [Planctomycetota bacterium]